jgi:DNA-binding transcriptional regulator GbsR (MarR family)
MESQIEEKGDYVGPFTAVFGNPTAKVLDQCLVVGNMEQTISMLAESTDLSYKTVLSVVEKFENLGFVTATRKIGNAQAYRFEVEKHLSEFIKCAQNLQVNILTQKQE